MRAPGGSQRETLLICLWPKADMTVYDSDVRFRGQSGHAPITLQCRLLTLKRHCGRLRLA